ncbi:MAG TPA: hypothetical protein VGP70_07395 [Actinomadura sp.]|jgi:hypothetical protein|nr:hypothetical protein [Actinomadura sp.]
MPKKYDISTRSGLKRWAAAKAKEVTKEYNTALEKEARRRPPTLPAPVPRHSGFTPSSELFSRGSTYVTNHINVNTEGQGNQVAVGNQGPVHQQSAITGMTSQDLAELVRQLRLAQEQLGLDDEDAAEFSQAVDRIDEESQSDTPNRGRLLRALTAAGLFLRESGTETATALSPLVIASIQALGG